MIYTPFEEKEMIHLQKFQYEYKKIPLLESTRFSLLFSWN